MRSLPPEEEVANTMCEQPTATATPHPAVPLVGRRLRVQERYGAWKQRGGVGGGVGGGGERCSKI